MESERETGKDAAGGPGGNKSGNGATLGGPLVALTRDSILGHHAPRIDRVDVPEFGGFVHVGILSARDRAVFDDAMYTAKVAIEQPVGGGRRRGKKGRRAPGAGTQTTSVDLHAHKVKALLVYLACVEENGDRMFTSKDELEKLELQPHDAIETIYDAATLWNGISSDEDGDGEAGVADGDDVAGESRGDQTSA